MEWALKNGDRVSAEPNDRAICPICNKEVISKCGSIKIWHWSHKSNKDCDDWYEPETEWHRDWKNQFPKECQEVTIKKCISDYCNNKKYHAPCNHINCVDCVFKSHRADIYEPHKMRVIELQNSSISSDDIKKREDFYKNMIWLLNGERISKGLILRNKKENIYTFRWKQPPKSWWFASKDIYIDLKYYEKELKEYSGSSINGNHYFKYLLQFRNKIFLIKKIYPNIPCGGWGELIDKEEFIKRFK